MVLVAATRLDQDIERFLGAFLRLRLERRLGAGMLEDHLEPFVVEELERRQDLAEVGARLFEDGLDRFKVGHGKDGDVVGLGSFMRSRISVSSPFSPSKRAAPSHETHTWQSRSQDGDTGHDAQGAFSSNEELLQVVA